MLIHGRPPLQQGFSEGTVAACRASHPIGVMALAGRLIEQMLALYVSNVSSPSDFSDTVTRDSRSDLERRAELNPPPVRLQLA
jgi:hypothetical protein